MSFIEQEIRKLRVKQLKIEFFKLVQEGLISTLRTKIPSGPDGDSKLFDTELEDSQVESICKEVKDELTAFIDAQIDMIDSGEVKNTEQIAALFDTKEVNVLKQLVSRATEKVNNIPPKQVNTVTKEQRLAELTANDPVKFALKNKHLEGKQVNCVNDNGTITGKVVGLSAPNVVVELASGHRIFVNINNIIVP